MEAKTLSFIKADFSVKVRQNAQAGSMQIYLYILYLILDYSALPIIINEFFLHLRYISF